MKILSSTKDDRTFAIIDLAIGVDLKAAKNVDALKSDQKILVKNLGTSTTKNAIIAAAKQSNLKSLELPINGKVLNLIQIYLQELLFTKVLQMKIFIQPLKKLQELEHYLIVLFPCINLLKGEPH
ncbi:hypothetical protein ACT405_07330 [Acinetobacter baumannii]